MYTARAAAGGAVMIEAERVAALELLQSQLPTSRLATDYAA